MQEKVKDYPNLVKVDRSYVINVDEDKYRTALLRKKTGKQLGSLEERVGRLENNIQLILDILQGQNNQPTGQE
jgi:hypothetical protein